MDTLPRTARTAGILSLVACSTFILSLDATIVLAALPSIARQLGSDPARMHIVISGYLLAMALLIPASGWLARRYGTRTVYCAALAAFTGGSLLAAMAGSLAGLLACRILQGMGGAMLLPVGRLAVLHAVPRAQLFRAMSVISMPSLLGPLLGPAAGGWLVEYASWRLVFLVSVPFGLACAAGAALLLPHAPRRHMPRFDFAGYLLLAGAIAGLGVALDGLPHGGAGALRLLLGATASLCALAAYARHAGSCRHPLFPLALLDQAGTRIALLGNLLCRPGSAAMPFLVPSLMQLCLGYTPTQAGLMLLPVAGMGMAVKWLAAPLVEHAGFRRVLLFNTVLLGLSIAGMGLLQPAQPWWMHALPLACFGAANALQLAALNTLALRELPSRVAGSGTALLSMVQMLAMGLGVAAAGGLLAKGMHAYQGAALGAFRAAFAIIGAFTMAASAVFLRLK